MQQPPLTPRMLATAVTFLSVVAITACGSSSAKTSTSTGPASGSSSSAAPSTSSSAAASSGSSGSGGASLTVSGDFSAAGKQSPGCGELRSQGGGNFEIPLTYTPTTPGGGIASGSDYSLQFLQIPAGKTQLSGTVPNPQTTIKFSFQTSDSDYLDWGVNALPPDANGNAAPGSASGSLDISSDGKQGTANLTLGFAGDDNHKVSSSAHKAIQITATWKCP